MDNNIIKVNNQYEFYKTARFDEDGKLLVHITNLTDRVTNEFVQEFFNGSSFDVESVHDGLIISIESDVDYSIILPPLADLPVGFHVTLKNTQNDGVKGVVVPSNGELIERQNELDFFGKGFIKLAKMIISPGNTEEWMISNYSSLEDTRHQTMD